MAKSYYIPDVEREVAEVDRTLLDLYARLCELDYTTEYTKNPSGHLYENFMEQVRKSEALEKRIGELKQLSQALKDGNTRVEDLSKEIKNTSKSIDLLYSRLGAILWEESASQDPDDELQQVSGRMKELQGDLQRLFQKSGAYKARQRTGGWAAKTVFKVREGAVNASLKSYQRKQDALFVSLGRELISSGRANLLKSDASASILEEYEKQHLHLEALAEEKDMIQEKVHHNRHTLEKEEGRASVQHRINDLNHEYRSIMKLRSDAAAAYGRYISTGIDLSMTDLPQVIRECQTSILEQQEMKKELLLSIKQLSIEKKIEEQVLLIRQDEEHIAHIQESIGQLHRQIEGVKKEMQGKQDQISHLQRQLKKLLPDEGSSHGSAEG